jgi:hypothetical protein
MLSKEDKEFNSQLIQEVGKKVHDLKKSDDGKTDTDALIVIGVVENGRETDREGNVACAACIAVSGSNKAAVAAIVTAMDKSPELAAILKEAVKKHTIGQVIDDVVNDFMRGRNGDNRGGDPLGGLFKDLFKHMKEEKA